MTQTSQWRRQASILALAASCALPARVCLAAAPAGAQTRPTESAHVADLINQLAADNSGARQAAIDELVRLGSVARPQVIEAEHADDPTTRRAAEQVLLKLPWDAPGDPPEVARILHSYATYAPPIFGQVENGPLPRVDEHDPAALLEARCMAARALASLPGDVGLPALARLVREDPSVQVRWVIVGLLRSTESTAALAPFRAMQPDAGDAALLAICGYARLDAADRSGETLLQAAFDREVIEPSADDGEVAILVNLLAARFIATRKFDEAADLYRRQLTRGQTPLVEQVPGPYLRLLALQADHGPLKGLEQDLAALKDYPSGDPFLLFVQAHLQQRLGNRDQSAALLAQAIDRARQPRQLQFGVARFLLDIGWLQDARTQMQAFLAAPGDDFGLASVVNAHFTMASIAAQLKDDQEAGYQLKDALSLNGDTGDLEMSDSRGRTWTSSSRAMWATVHWHFLKAALARQDEPKITQELDEIVKLNPDDSEVVLDAVPALVQRHRDAQAQTLFTAAYTPLKAKLTADPGNASYMNDVAWLEAMCGMKLDEALTMANHAVALAPGDASLLDTLAHVEFVRHNAAKAVELEREALALEPDNTFMAGEVKRFAAAH